MKIRSMLASVAIAFVAVGGGTTAAGAATTHPSPMPMASGNVALAMPAQPSVPTQYASFTAFPRSGWSNYHGWVDYANFTYPASHTNVWNIAGQHQLTFKLGSGTYAHTMTVSTVTPTSTHSTKFSGTGTYNVDPAQYKWTVSGTVDWNAVTFSIVYTGANSGYKLSGHGWIAKDGSVSGFARDSNGKVLSFTMAKGSAFQVLRYTAQVTWTSVSGHNASFGYTIPKSAPKGLAGLHIVVKVHDGGSGYQHDTWAHGVTTSWHNGPVTNYPITSGNILVRR